MLFRCFHSNTLPNVPLQAAGNMNCMMPNMQPMQPMQTMQPMQPMQSMQSPMVPMCMPMVPVPQQVSSYSFAELHKKKTEMSDGVISCVHGSVSSVRGRRCAVSLMHVDQVISPADRTSILLRQPELAMGG